MSNAKPQFRHELKNAISVLSILISESGLGLVQKKEMERWMHKIVLLLSYESLILGEKFRSVKSSVDVSELVLVVGAIVGKGVLVPPKNGEWRVEANRDVLLESIRLIAEEYADIGNPTEIIIDSSKRILRIQGKLIKPVRLEKGDLLASFRRKSGPDGWPIQLAMRLLGLNRIRYRVEPGAWILDLGRITESTSHPRS